VTGTAGGWCTGTRTRSPRRSADLTYIVDELVAELLVRLFDDVLLLDVVSEVVCEVEVGGVVVVVVGGVLEVGG